jgi:arylamine N-acetyltransferase
MPLSVKKEADYIKDVNGFFRAVDMGQNKFHVQKWLDNHWRTTYEGTVASRSIDEFDAVLDYNQHNENSIFVKKLVVTMPKLDGRVTMSENDLTITKHGGKSKIAVTKDNYQRLLREYFGLDVKIDRLENPVDI